MGLYDKRPTLPSILLKVGLGTLWALGVGGSMAVAMRYEATPGRAGKAAPSRSSGREVVMVVHPDCPCTGASVRALQRLLTEASVPVKANLLIVAYGPASHAAAQEKYARAVPAAKAEWISAEQAKAKYGAYTSGHVIAYVDGKPVFRGGLTSGRGVESTSESQLRLKDFLAGKPVDAASPVFGCALNGEKL